MEHIENKRDYYPVKDNDKFLIAEIDRTYADDISVRLPCGYLQRFWVDITDTEAIARCEEMKRLKIESA